MEKNFHQPTTLPKTNIFLIIFYALITLGIYLPFWFITRFNMLDKEFKVDGTTKFLAYIIGIAQLGVLIANIVSGYYSVLAQNEDLFSHAQLSLTINESIASNTASLIAQIGFIILIITSLKMKSLLEQKYNVKFSSWLAGIFNILYLQYIINKHDLNQNQRNV